MVAGILARMCRLPGHVFWPDDITLRDADCIDAGALLSTGHITDLYLLALAVAHGGRLATLDRRIGPEPVRGGQAALTVIRILSVANVKPVEVVVLCAPSGSAFPRHDVELRHLRIHRKVSKVHL